MSGVFNNFIIIFASQSFYYELSWDLSSVSMYNTSLIKCHVKSAQFPHKNTPI